jgi:hypothetical protein
MTEICSVNQNREGFIKKIVKPKFGLFAISVINNSHPDRVQLCLAMYDGSSILKEERLAAYMGNTIDMAAKGFGGLGSGTKWQYEKIEGDENALPTDPVDCFVRVYSFNEHHRF